MRFLILFVLIATSYCATSAEIDCTFDQENQIEVLKEMMAKHPGGTLNIAEKTITWSEKNKVTEYTYGGCAHIGATVTVSQLKVTPRNEKETFRYARELADRYWDASIAKILSEALKNKTFRLEGGLNMGTYHIAHESYSMLYLEHRYENSRETVKISWLGNY